LRGRKKRAAHGLLSVGGRRAQGKTVRDVSPTVSRSSDPGSALAADWLSLTGLSALATSCPEIATIFRTLKPANDRENHPSCARAGRAMKSRREEPAGRPLVAVEERASGNWTIARLCSLRQGEGEERGKSAGREIQVFATFGIVHAEYDDGVQVYSSGELFGRRAGCSLKSASRLPI